MNGEEVTGCTHGKDQGDTTPDGFRPVKVGFVADEQVLLARGSLPREDRGAKEEDLDGLAGRQARGDSGVVARDGHLRRRDGGRDGDRGGFLGSFHDADEVDGS